MPRGREGARPRSARSPRAALALLLTAACACGGSGSAARALPGFDAERAWRDLVAQVEIGPRPAGSEAAERTRAYIEAELAAAGLEPVREPFSAETPIGRLEMANVYADLEGRPRDGKPPPMVVLAAHYDTKRLPFHFVGANDGASGTAVLLELARVLAAGGPRPVTYRFLFLDGEEAVRTWVDPDNRYGSRHHVARLQKSGLARRVAACVVIDLVGDRDLRLQRDTYSDSWLVNAFFGAARDLGLGAHVEGRNEPIKDDHLSFLEADIPSVDLIDLDYGPGNSYWHSPEDSLENVSKESLEITGRIVLAGLPRVEERVLR